MATAFAQTRTTVLSLSTQLSNALSNYAQFANNTTTTLTNDEEDSQLQVQSLIDQFTTSIKDLNRIVDSQPTISTSKLQQLARHKDELTRFRLDYQRLKSTIDQERNRLNLLFTVRSDIEDHNTRTRNINNGGSNALSDEDYMLDERLRVNRSHGIVDGLLSQVMETRDEIMRQRNILGSVGNKLGQTLSQVPGINVLMSKIDSRHKKEAIILTCVILVCLIFLWFVV